MDAAPLSPRDCYLVFARRYRPRRTAWRPGAAKVAAPISVAIIRATAAIVSPAKMIATTTIAIDRTIGTAEKAAISARATMAIMTETTMADTGSATAMVIAAI